MAIDFPNTPINNETFTSGNNTWQWNGVAWNIVTASTPVNYVISDTAPSSPIEGSTWFDSSTTKLYIYYDSHWIETTSSIAGPTGPAGTDGVIGADGVDGVDGATGPTGPSGTLTRSIRTVSASTSLLSGDQNQLIRFTGTSDQILTIDDVLSPGASVKVLQDNSGGVDFQSGAGVTLLSNSGNFLSNVQNNVIEVLCVGVGQYRLFGVLESLPINVEYLVIAGGGGGGRSAGAGGGAGGYRSSITGESSGGGASAESSLTLLPATNYTVTIGAGGAGMVNGAPTPNGSNSVFGNITPLGGGGGGGHNENGAANYIRGKDGGSGGGNWAVGAPVGQGTAGQGFAGGIGTPGPGYGETAGGGGGAGAVGANGVNSTSNGNGGVGVTSSVTGSSIVRGGGGGAGSGSAAVLGGGLGGSGGGGNGGKPTSSTDINGFSGVANTGGGGGGGSYIGQFATIGSAGAGGSGVVIIRYPSANTVTVGAGLTATTSTVGANKVTTFTAGTGTISFS